MISLVIVTLPSLLDLRPIIAGLLSQHGRHHGTAGRRRAEFGMSTAFVPAGCDREEASAEVHRPGMTEQPVNHTSSATAGIVCVRRPVVRRIIDRLTKMIPRLPARGLVPETGTLWRSTAWTTVPFLFSGTAFGLLLLDWSDMLALLSTIGVFAISWLVGFLVFPLPSGVGAREAVLLLLLPGLPAAQVVGVSLAHRFATLVAELVLLSAVSHNAFMRTERSE